MPSCNESTVGTNPITTSSSALSRRTSSCRQREPLSLTERVHRISRSPTPTNNVGLARSFIYYDEKNRALRTEFTSVGEAIMKSWRIGRVLLVTVALAGSILHAQTPPIVESPLDVAVPISSCSIPRAAISVSLATKTPIGVETVPGECLNEGQPRRGGSSISLQGMTPDEAFNTLVKLDSRYRWASDAGVLVIRPREVWEDSEHFLNRQGDGLVFTDLTIVEALPRVATLMSPRSFDGFPTAHAPTQQLMKRFSVEMQGASLLDVANAIVRTHGGVLWTMNYCGTSATADNATIRFTTFDGRGIGFHPVFQSDPSGKRYDSCASSARAR